jgi:hypothetical protein
VAGAAIVLGTLPDWLDFHFARTASGVLAVIAIVMGLIILFMVRSVALRVVAVVVLAAAVFGLLHYRSELDHCDKNGCACQLFGEDLKGGGCAPS